MFKSVETGELKNLEIRALENFEILTKSDLIAFKKLIIPRYTTKRNVAVYALDVILVFPTSGIDHVKYYIHNQFQEFHNLNRMQICSRYTFKC